MTAQNIVLGIVIVAIVLGLLKFAAGMGKRPGGSSSSGSARRSGGGSPDIKI